MTDRIDHAAEARLHIHWAHKQQAETGEFDHTVRDNAVLANAEATLALVEQQRIANLIALASMDDGDPRTATPLAAATGFEALTNRETDLRPEIAAALGVAR